MIWLGAALVLAALTRPGTALTRLAEARHPLPSLGEGRSLATEVRVAPAFRLPDTAWRVQSLGQFRGRPVVAFL